MTKADARFAPDGYQYGVRFMDGSVAAQWNGRTQHERAEAYIQYLNENYRRDRFVLVRRQPDSPWEEVR